MASINVRHAKNYPDLVLFIEVNTRGEQILKLRFEDPDGNTKYVWYESNEAGTHRKITPAFLLYLQSAPFILQGEKI